jgi:hypothetical protein
MSSNASAMTQSLKTIPSADIAKTFTFLITDVSNPLKSRLITHGHIVLSSFTLHPAAAAIIRIDSIIFIFFISFNHSILM